MIRFDVVAYGSEPLVIQFQPAANEMVLAVGDRITIEWPDWDGKMRAVLFVEDGKLTIGKPSTNRESDTDRSGDVSDLGAVPPVEGP